MYRVSTKNFTLIWKVMAPLIFIIVIKVRGDSDSTFAELSVEYHNFPVAQQGAEIFEFKVDPVPKLTFLNVMSGVKYWANIKLKYLSFLLSYRKVMVFNGKLCSCTFRITSLIPMIILRGATAFQSQRKCLTKLQTSHSKKLILVLGQL